MDRAGRLRDTGKADAPPVARGTGWAAAGFPSDGFLPENSLMRNSAQDRGPTSSGPDRDPARGFADALRDRAHGYAGKRRADAVRVVSDVGDAIRDSGAGFDGLPHVKAFFEQAALG